MINSFHLSNHRPFSSPHPDVLELFDNLRRAACAARLPVAGGDLLEQPLCVGVGAQQRPLQHVQVHTLVLRAPLLSFT